MNKVVITRKFQTQVVFVGSYIACKQYVDITHPNGVFVDFWGNEWKVSIE